MNRQLLDRLDRLERVILLDSISVHQAAKYYGVCTKTVRRWIKKGKLKAEKKGRDYRIKKIDL